MKKLLLTIAAASAVVAGIVVGAGPAAADCHTTFDPSTNKVVFCSPGTSGSTSNDRIAPTVRGPALDHGHHDHDHDYSSDFHQS
ncbi:hypothetical protein QSJ18_10415 [Gordonia sp. ABSL1-1]|uniref:hypothetical protein n=1 Tax=Gordonia sp. ABSL1-1 TaxID=3053923 RepID=UPI00257330B9|nr:hypothetical protein [Gordonia sp. ABSL1-1]MDL9937156.1 hypothetical protein [Gordonia sp. ABSL1-1]